MNESDFATLLESGSADIDPDVERIVTGAADRGRRSLLRRRLGTGAAVAALAIAAGVGVTVAADGPDRREGVDTATAPDRTGPMRFGEEQRSLAPRDEVRERLLEMLPEGEVTDVTVTGYGPAAEWGRDPGVEISLLFNGAAVGFHLGDQTFDRDAWAPPAPGERPEGCRAEWAETSWSWLSRFSRNGDPSDPAHRACGQWVAASLDYACFESPDCTPRYARAARGLCPDCIQRPDGTWLWARSGSGGDGSPSAMDGNWATRYTTDGWEVHADAFNVVDENAFEVERVADEPVLTLDQVTAIALSDVWFE